MEFTAAKKDFASALAKAQGIPEQRNLSSVMANILLESIGDDAVRLTAQSYEVTLVTTFPAHVTKPGKMALTARSLTDRARMLPEAPVSLSLMDNQWANLSVGARSSTIPGILPENMPEIADPAPVVEILFPRALLLEIADRVGFAMSVDEGRPNLNGINICVNPCEGGASIDAVATDGHRLSWVNRVIPTGGAPVEQVTAILHRKGVADLKRFLEGVEGDVKVGFLRHAVVFTVDNGYLLVRQIELEYPEFRKVVPAGFRFSVDFNRDEFISAVKWAQPSISQEKTPLVRLRFEPGKITVMARDPERGDANTGIDAAYEGETFEIAYNNRYLLEALSAMGGDAVRLSIKGEASASLLTSPDDEGLKQVIMPVRI
jgi:DNA polymerase-3 subunit beta